MIVAGNSVAQSPKEATEHNRKWTTLQFDWKNKLSKNFSAVNFAKPYGDAGRGSVSDEIGLLFKWLNTFIVDIFTNRL